MNTKEIFRAIGFGLTIIVAAILFTGCLDPAGYNTGLTYQDYPGPSLPREQVAFLKLDKDMTWNPIAYSGIGVCEIDGKKVHYKFGDTIQLAAPGIVRPFAASFQPSLRDLRFFGS
jgi:hypothetical protein